MEKRKDRSIEWCRCQEGSVLRRLEGSDVDMRVEIT
jgi:hypothetical protein